MGKLAQVLGVGIKGQLRLELEREKYQAGEQIYGTIFLSIEEQIYCDGALMLDIRGLETIAWIKSQGDNTTHHRDKHVIIHKQLQISTGRETFSPGEYAYQFSYELQPTLPGSFQLSHRSADRLRNIRSAVKYELKARQPVQGAFRADLETKRELTRAMYQKLSAAHYHSVLLPSFQTPETVRRCTLEVATDATPAEDFITFQEMKIRSSTARAMLAYDRDVNAAKNNFHKNMSLLR
ncbi:hypothetical protein V7S43_015277 [Phytophthora oleae]|uniref:Arrestin-like N-terminal domain-containing protein n=1 Tax=Phytophthora oleae TaxID=2107226 RepID=A0ABD3F0I2_9STRA